MSIYPRTEYEMTQEDLDALMKAFRPVPMIKVGGSFPRSQQENANDAWAALGARMGFEWDTVRPAQGKGDRFFTAIPSETAEQRQARESREAAAKRELEIEDLRARIAENEARIKELTAAGEPATT